MTESEWLKATDPDAMLALVAPHLSPRRWKLLACALVRRVWDLLADDRLRAAVEWAERNAGVGGPDPGWTDLLFAIEPGAATAADAAGAQQRRIVLAADPDSDPDRYRHTEERRTNPSAPLFQAAARYAASAVEAAREAATAAARRAVPHVLSDSQGVAWLSHVRDVLVHATRAQAVASLHASLALKFKALGDECADHDTGRNVRLRYSAAVETLRREEEYAGYRESDLLGQKQRADRKALGRLLHDLCGNPFRPVRFAPAWRTGTVVGLAAAVDADRAFDRLPILADALLDADCDAEAVLRHCRGTEPHAPDCPHVRGCWVIDLILGHEPPVRVNLPTGRRRAAPAGRRRA